MRIVAISNQKGGVGKTTTSANLGAALAERGLRVLVVDLDPQGNLSTHLGIDIYQLERSVYDVLTQGTAIHTIIQAAGIEGLYCAPSNIDLSGAEVEMVSAVGRETILKEALSELERQTSDNPFDVVLIDCPPSLGLLCINALAAADEILIPMQTEFFALQGMSKLMDVVALVRRRINPGLEIGGIVACRMDVRTRLANEVLDDIREHFDDLLFETRIRQNVKLAESPSFGQTVIEYDPESKGAADYRDLAAEFLGLSAAEDDELEEEEEEEAEDEEKHGGEEAEVDDETPTQEPAPAVEAE